MQKKTDELINLLAQQHKPKPFWKNFHVLLVLWLCLDLVVFIADIVRGEASFKASPSFIVLNLILSGFSWLFFTKNLNKTSDANWNRFFLVSLFLLVIAGFFYTDYSGFVLHERPLSMHSEDLNCFTHILLLAVPSAILFPFFLKNFFVEKIWFAIGLMAIHISLLSISVVEIQCSGREFWHLILGHQTGYLSIFAIFIGSYTLVKRLTSSDA
jgi:hypothetical protein